MWYIKATVLKDNATVYLSTVMRKILSDAVSLSSCISFVRPPNLELLYIQRKLCHVSVLIV